MGGTLWELALWWSGPEAPRTQQPLLVPGSFEAGSVTGMTMTAEMTAPVATAGPALQTMIAIAGGHIPQTGTIAAGGPIPVPQTVTGPIPDPQTEKDALAVEERI